MVGAEIELALAFDDPKMLALVALGVDVDPKTLVD